MDIEHVVVQGECLVSIAAHYRMRDWRALYNYPPNADFRRLRPNPNLILPGDKLFVPATPSRRHGKPTDRAHTFKAGGVKACLRIVLRNEGGDPFANCKFQVRMGDRLVEGTTSADGVARFEAPSSETRAEFRLSCGPPGREYAIIWDLHIGHLDPIHEVTGVQGRLTNLGFPCGPVDGDIGPLTRIGVSSFQQASGLTVTGEPDEQTRSAIVDAHGGT